MVSNFESEPVPLEISANTPFFAMRMGFYGPMLKRKTSGHKTPSGICRKHEAKIKKALFFAAFTFAHLSLCAAAIFLRAAYR
jgi:hypothetical protein